MEFNEVIKKRKTSREWTDREVDFEAIKRIIEAGMRAPSWDHYRNWQFIVLHEQEDKERALHMQRVLPNAMLTATAPIYAQTRHKRCTLTPCRGNTPCWLTAHM